MTCKLGLSDAFIPLLVHSVIAYLRSLATDAYLENFITKSCHIGHPPFHCSAVITTSGVARLSAALSTPQICLQTCKVKEDHVSFL